MQSKFARGLSRNWALAALVFASAALGAPTPLLAGATAATEPRTLSVTGQGEIKAVPDEAQLSTGVENQARTAAAALAQNREAMNAVFATLKERGIPERSIQTSGFNVSPLYDSGKDGNGPRTLTGYQVSNTVSVTVDDLSKLGATIDALVASGSNSLGGVSFSIRDPKPLLRQARAEAVKDAMDRAQTFARAAGVTLGRVTEISEGGASMPRPMFRAMAVMADAAPTPIAAGEETVSASVSMSFEIK